MKAQKECARKNIVPRPQPSSNVLGSLVTPRRQHLLDLVASAQRKNARFTETNTELINGQKAMARRVDDLARKLHNTSRKWTRAVKTKSVVREDLRRSKHNTVILRSRVDRRQEGGIAAALKKARVGVGAHWMKGEMGIFSEQSREMVRDLVGFKVAPSNMDGVIHTVAHGIGVELQDHISLRQVGRMIEEGGIASDLQVASEIQAAKAFTLSGDGTTIRHLKFEAKHVTYFRPGENVPVTRMLNTTSARNHTSEEQLAGWQDTIQRSLVYTYNASPLGQENSIDNDEFVTFIKGIGADHAPD
ncbi:hypothetical protein B0H13DRAFT_2369247 [Mycena leptocephala]|nr:hypothetical protein B0H13DRAFT_2369247 [Mycena leptocephala]